MRATLDRAGSSSLCTLDDPVETALFASLVTMAVNALGPHHVLDVGCGEGLPTIAAARAGAQHVLGIDIMECNVERARAEIKRAGLEHRVAASHAAWEDVASGRLDVGPVDLVVANPPYVPSGEGVAVNGGPTGTRLIASIIEALPGRAKGLAVLLGSLSDPLHVLDLLSCRHLAVRKLLMQSVPFGSYTSRPTTLAHLVKLRARGRAFFCDTLAPAERAPHAYLTLGFVTARCAGARQHNAAVRSRLAALLASYQERGPRTVPAGASLMPL
jgi:SAM-dependent methyltransferase